MSARFKARLLLAALAALASCNAADRSEDQRTAQGQRGVVSALPSATAPDANAAQPARARLDELDEEAPPTAAAAPDPAAVTRNWFVGRWSDSGNCADAGAFARNGTYLLADGTRGMWNVQDSRLTVQHAGGRTVIRLRRIDDRTVETANDDGSTGRSVRC